MSSGEEHLPKPGEVLAGKYRIERIIGKGGMGAVLSAHHEMLGQRVAIKFLLGEIAQNPEAVARFNNEARNAFKIQSEHVCRVMDVGVEHGMPFMVMEFLEGGDLSQLLEQRGALPVEEAVDYVLQGLEAIAQAHALGIVHRDLKPANLFLHRRQDGSQLVKVLDFGIAKANNPLGDPSGGHGLTSTKSMLGSPLYMSPEQLRSAKNVDARADIWALGVILYELLTGTVPFNGETLGELFIAILEQPPPPVSQRRPDVPQVLSDAVMRCLHRPIEQRFANVAELAQALAPCAPGRSSVSVDRIAQALGLPKPQLSMPDAGGPRASYPGVSGQYPPQLSSSQSGPQPQAFSSSQSGVHQFSPQGGTQLLGSSTNSTWGNTAGGQPPKSKIGLIVGGAVAAVMLLGVLGVGGVFVLKHRAAAAAADLATPATAAEPPKADPPKADPPKTDPTAQQTAPTATAATSVAASAPPATTTKPAATAAATSQTSHHSHTTTAAAATTPTPPATHAQPTATAFNPLGVDRR